jgi:hypothetical protein
LKTSMLSSDSLTSGSIPPMHTPHQQDETLFSALRRGLRTVFMKLGHMGSAIALGEAGDLDGAHALREQHAKQRA